MSSSPIIYQFITHDTAGGFCVSDDGTSVDFYASKRTGPDNHFRSTVERLEARRSGAEYGLPAGARADLIDLCLYAIHLQLGGTGLKKSDLQVPDQPWGVHFPRMWRGRYSMRDFLATYVPFHAGDVYGQTYLQSVLASTSLFEELCALFRYIEPSQKNTATYGHRVRELLILACTEVEAAWKGTLTANLPTVPDRCTTKEYFRLAAPLHLKEWSVCLSDYPDVAPMSPFSTWNDVAATKSLPWYDAYNAVKHDREADFHRASLGNLIEAMGALHIMQCAMWGPEIFDNVWGHRRSPFRLTALPKFEAKELYMPSPPDDRRVNRWTSRKFFP